MKITKELLKRHGQGLCSDEERRAVEEWFETYENPFEGEPIFDSNKIDREGIWSKLSEITTGLHARSTFTNTPIFSLYHKIIKYAAAACIIFAVFFVGRFSVDTVSATAIVDKAPKDYLYVFGMNGIVDKLPGKYFKVKFNDTIKLYNESYETKNIQVGDSSFILEPQQIYFLSGSPQEPTLTNTKLLPNDYPRKPELAGDFSILRLDIK